MPQAPKNLALTPATRGYLSLRILQSTVEALIEVAVAQQDGLSNDLIDFYHQRIDDAFDDVETDAARLIFKLEDAQKA